MIVFDRNDSGCRSLCTLPSLPDGKRQTGADLFGYLSGSNRLNNVRAVLGFTAIELMVTLAVVGILVALAVPALGDATLSSQLSASANRLAASATLARSEAIKRNASVVVCMSADGTSCASSGGWEQGWVMLRGTTVLSREQAANNGFKMIVSPSSATSLTFDATGVGATQATVTVCRALPNAGAQERVVTISATGRATVTKTSTGTCA
jgi:type IV fimbrial biogenesis protein FimT